jgi:hypothetical protein
VFLAQVHQVEALLKPVKLQLAAASAQRVVAVRPQDSESVLVFESFPSPLLEEANTSTRFQSL